MLMQIGGTPEQHLEDALGAIIKAETAIFAASALTENVDKRHLEDLHGAIRIASLSLQDFMNKHPDGYKWEYSFQLTR